MDATSQARAASSIDAVNQLLETATQAAMKQTEKMMKVTVAMAVGRELGKGETVDLSV